METWARHMPAGMLLKSEGFASNLYDPEGQCTLERFCAQNGLPYADIGVPVPLETMVAYGRSFQQGLVPDLEDRAVLGVERESNDFVLQLDNGEKVVAQKVIVAVGYSYYQYVPPSLDCLPPEFLSHSSQVHDLGPYEGRDVTVVGAGASALELAVLLQENGAQVRLLARRSSVVFNPKPAHRPWWRRIVSPLSRLGMGWKTYLFCDAPMLFRYLRRETRLRIVKNVLGPAGGWPIQERFEGRVPTVLGYALQSAEVRDGRVHLQLCDDEGAQSGLVTGHVIAATGFRVDLRRLIFLGESIRPAIREDNFVPVLSRDFQSSIPGLYFVGFSSTNYFGPSMRFVVGARYTAQRIAKHLSHTARP
jgi:hypothetical protein